MAFAHGFGYGLAAILLLGPVLFTLLKASLEHGFKGGFAVALGIIIGDIIVVVICMSGWLAGFYKLVDQRTIAIGAGLILLLLGLKYVLWPDLNTQEDKTLSTRNIMGLFSAGFLVNFVNPFVFTVWIGLTIHTNEVYGDSALQWTFMLGALSGIFLGDLLKAVFAPKLKTFLKEDLLTKTYRFFGLIFICFSIRAFFFALQ